MTILRVTAVWSGFTGAPGYTNFHFMGGGGLISDAQQVAERVGGALENLATVLPRDVQISLRPELEVIDEATGEVQGYQQTSGIPAVTGTATGSFSGPVGAVVNWTTNDLRFGRRIRGRTFIVPLAGTAFWTAGGLNANAQNSIRAFANELQGGDLDSELVVWSRPRNGSGGVAATVTGNRVPAKAAVLRSRRD